MNNKVTSKWCGFWGGWRSEKGIVEHIAQETRDRWHLIANEIRLALWF